VAKFKHLKSALMAYCSCPRYMKALYIDKVEPIESEEALIGTSFHDFASEFFSRAPYKKAVRARSLLQIEELFRELVKDDSPELRRLELNFCDFEARHLWNLKHVVANPRKYFFPIDIELSVETKTASFRVDRIDLLTTGESCVVEYKTSAWWNKTLLRRELAFYCVGLKSIKKYRDIHPVTHIMVYNPRLDRYMFEKLSRRTVISMLGWLDQMAQSIRDNKFPRKFSGLCRYCPISKECYEEVPKWNLESTG